MSKSYVIQSPSLKFAFNPQDCLEGIGGIDPHIGGNDLHRICYDALKPAWLKWSKGYDVPMERTTLQGIKVHAAITGKAQTQPTKQRDAMWHFFYKIRGRAAEPTFKGDQLDLAVVIDQEDFEAVEDRREQALDLDAADDEAPSSVAAYIGSNSSEVGITHSELSAPTVPPSETILVSHVSQTCPINNSESLVSRTSSNSYAFD